MTSRFPNLDSDASAHLERFIRAFVTPRRRGRWYSVLAMPPGSWGGASAYDCAVPPFDSPHVRLDRTLEAAGVASLLDAPAWVFAIGAGAGAGCSRGTLRQALLPDGPLLECVVSILPGRAAICYGHAGEVRVCRAAEPPAAEGRGAERPLPDGSRPGPRRRRPSGGLRPESLPGG